jgi:lipid-A-disaccharide synthase
MKKIMIMSGEASGDLHGANLAREIQKQDPSIALYGVGSARMKEAGVQILADASEISVVGLTEVLTHISAIRRVYVTLKQFLRHERPDLLVLIDFPDFNMLLGKAAKKIGIPVLYYISPQVWAWRKGRIKKIASLVKAIIVVFPFEVQLYDKEKIDVRFVGHPLMDVVKSDLTEKQARNDLCIDVNRRTVALLPGSRKSEIIHLLPDMLSAARILSSRFPDLQFILPIAPTLDREFVLAFTSQAGVLLRIVEGRVYDVLKASDTALVASGTATLETGIMGVPMVIMYRVSPLTYFIGKHFIDVDHVGLVNIVAGKRIVPELIQDEVTPGKIADAVTSMLTDQAYYKRIRADLAEVKTRLGEPGASRRAALVVRELLAQS